MEYYTSWLKRIRKDAETAAVFPNLSNGFPLPRVLNPGDEWQGLIPQKRIDKDMDMERMSQSGHLMIWLSRSDKQQAFRQRLTITQSSENDS